jgi:hypothetical protein
MQGRIFALVAVAVLAAALVHAADEASAPMGADLPAVGTVLRTFTNELCVEWDDEAHVPRSESEMKPLRKPLPGPVTMEVRVMAVPGGAEGAKMRGVFVKEGMFPPGHMVGCYSATGPLITMEERTAKQERIGKDLGEYMMTFNETYFIDPTDEEGNFDVHVASPMGFVNEPSRGMLPNVVLLDGGMCRTPEGFEGRPFYAFRNILPGDEVTICYGMTYEFAGHYETICESQVFFHDFIDHTRVVVEDLLGYGEQPLERVEEM